MIYSKRNAKNEHLVGYKGIVTEGPSYINCPYIPKFWQFIDLECTSKKLEAISIDPAFLISEPIDFDYEAEMNELMIDYDTFFPEDKA